MSLDWPYLWAQLSETERQDAVTALARALRGAKYGVLGRLVRERLAQRSKCRPQSIPRWPAERLAREIGRLPGAKPLNAEWLALLMGHFQEAERELCLAVRRVVCGGGGEGGPESDAAREAPGEAAPGVATVAGPDDPDGGEDAGAAEDALEDAEPRPPEDVAEPWAALLEREDAWRVGRALAYCVLGDRLWEAWRGEAERLLALAPTPGRGASSPAGDVAAGRPAAAAEPAGLSDPPAAGTTARAPGASSTTTGACDAAPASAPGADRAPEAGARPDVDRAVPSLATAEPAGPGAVARSRDTGAGRRPPERESGRSEGGTDRGAAPVPPADEPPQGAGTAGAGSTGPESSAGSRGAPPDAATGQVVGAQPPQAGRAPGEPAALPSQDCGHPGIPPTGGTLPGGAEAARGAGETPSQPDTAPAVAAPAVAAQGTVAAEPAAPPGPAAAPAFPWMSVLDRVLVDQVLATAAGEQGALDRGDVTRLLASVVSLNTTRHQSYFHLGFGQGLLGGPAAGSSPGGFDESQRDWYLVGQLLACRRRDDERGLAALLAAHGKHLRRLAAAPGEPGETLAREAFDALLGHRHLAEAVALLKGQPALVGNAEQALRAVTDDLGRGDTGLAQALLPVLNELAGTAAWERVDAARARTLRRELTRCLGQLLQAKGDFEGAGGKYAQLLGETSDPGVLADFGLCLGGFRRLEQVRLPGPQDQRDALREGLERGEPRFREAVALGETAATNAHYALAVLNFLRLRDTPCQLADEQRVRRQAIGHAQAALTGMRLSEGHAAYAALGLVGQVLFILAVLQMQEMDHTAARKALEAWGSITEEAGRLPTKDLRELIQAAEVVDHALARELAESVWRFRPQDAAEVLDADAWLAEIDGLREALLARARNAALPRTDRWKEWRRLLPVLLARGERNTAVQGLDELEQLAAEDSRIARLLVDWLEDADHYDPAWSEEECLWARVRLLLQVGRVEQSGALLRKLYYRALGEDSGWADELLLAFREFRLPDHYWADLPAAEPAAEAVAAANQDAGQGEPLRVLFIGGNEIQARRDDKVRRALEADWPALQIHFEHTGWSPNWGRDLGRLMALANDADAVVLMRMMRTMLGRGLREGLRKPWIPCTGTGSESMLRSVVRAAQVALDQRRGAARR